MVSEARKEEIKELLRQGHKIFLDKDYEAKHTRHAYYYQENNVGWFFYHIKFSFYVDNDKPLFTDYPTVEVPSNKKDELYKSTFNNFINEIVDYIDRCYTITCSREDEE